MGKSIFLPGLSSVRVWIEGDAKLLLGNPFSVLTGCGLLGHRGFAAGRIWR
jgi:hypothetical protein